MFDTLFRYTATVARHQGGRFAAARELFLNHCASQGSPGSPALLPLSCNGRWGNRKQGPCGPLFLRVAACQNKRVVKKRLLGALIVYGILITLACFLLRGQFLWAVLILFGGLLAKTLIALKTGSHVPD